VISNAQHPAPELARYDTISAERAGDSASATPDSRHSSRPTRQ
jgi:hypothetical protein